MKIPALNLLAALTLVNGQITSWGNGTVACLKPGGSFCLGPSLGTDYIVNCDDNGVAKVSSCCDILAAKFPLGAAATCWQTSPNSGDAGCEKNCVAYCGSNTSVLPTQQCTPTTTQPPTGAATPCHSDTATVPHAPDEPLVSAPGIPGESTAPGVSVVPTTSLPADPGQPGIPTSPVPGEPPIPPPAGSGSPPAEPTVVPTTPTVSVPSVEVPTDTTTGPGGMPPSVATPPPEGTEPPMVPTAGAPIVEHAGAAMVIVGLAAIYLL